MKKNPAFLILLCLILLKTLAKLVTEASIANVLNAVNAISLFNDVFINIAAIDCATNLGRDCIVKSPRFGFCFNECNKRIERYC